MTADEYRDALAKWKLRHKAAADFFGITVITSQRYATGERDVPPPMAKLIRLMLSLRYTPAYVDSFTGNVMNRWPEISEERLIDAVVRWLGSRGHLVEAAAGIPGLYHIDGGPELTTNQVISIYRQKIGLEP